MRTPTLAQTVEALKRCAVAADRLEQPVKWANAVAARPRSESPSATSGPSDSTGEEAADKLRSFARQMDREAREMIVKALVHLDGATANYGLIEEAMQEADRRKLDEPMTSGELDRERHRVTTAELRTAQRAKARRLGRGEGWGQA